jgi:hypothetical protein
MALPADYNQLVDEVPADEGGQHTDADNRHEGEDQQDLGTHKGAELDEFGVQYPEEGDATGPR